MGALTYSGNIIAGMPTNASQVNYDNSSSGMTATQVQDAVDELKSGLTDVNSYKSQGNNNGYIIPVYVMRPAENDCNTFVNAGIYQCENATNAPTTGWCTIFAIPFGAVSTNYVQQICFAISSNKIYHRYRNGGIWGEWVQLHS